MQIVNAPLNITLHSNQAIINSHPAKNKVIKAGKRFGKTYLAVYTLTRAAGRKSNGIFWYIAPTYKQAKQIAWTAFKSTIPPVFCIKTLENDLEIRLKNGSLIKLIGADDEDSLRGPKIDGAVFDECAYIKSYVYDGIVSGQLLGANGEPSGFAFFISSPNKEGRNWFTDFHKEAAYKQAQGNPDWASFYYTIYDNPTLSREEIEKIRARIPDDIWQLEYMAIESDYAGKLYPEFSRQDHVSPIEYNPKFPLFRAIDWGIDHPTVCLWIQVDLGRKMVYVLDEFYKTGFLIRESCSAIKAMTLGRFVDWTVIDPATSKRNSQTPRTDKDEFQRWGIPCIPGDNRDRGIDIMKMFFKLNMVRIHPKCKNLIYQLENVQRSDKVGNDTTDALRYGFVRINDWIFGNNILHEAEGQSSTRPPNVYNLNDSMFQKNKQSKMGWAYDENPDIEDSQEDFEYATA